ncbi:MAG TPA: hypothetical protein VN192_01370 [Flavobacterium sp.]|nr:hypothetical protein [Flavobacterium sp.]
MYKYKFCLITIVCLLIIFPSKSFAQQTKTDSISIFKDTLDHKLDLSRFIIDAKGFVPVPMIITEPALGNFGLALGALFLTPKKRPEGYKGYIPPDVTAGFGMYTANNSWALGALRIGNIPKYGIKYRALVAYADVNLSFYEDFEYIGEKELEFNIEAIPYFLSVSKKISKYEIYFGTQYLHSKNILTPNFNDGLPESITSIEIDGTIGTLGVFLDFDTRNTIFTPDKGWRVNLLYGVDDNWTGSDYDFQKFTGFVNWFFPIQHNWISGLRFEAQQTYGNPPFYLLPFINMRGIPIARYQGETTLLVETDQRFDFNSRWSVVAFGGLGKTINENQSFIEGENVYSFGTGFRYLLARAFGMRAGIDIAKGTDSYGYYIVVGHSWNR